MFVETRFDTSLSALFESSLTDACVSRFGLRTHVPPFPADLLRSSGVIVLGSCVLYVFSASRMYCLCRTSRTVEVLVWKTPSAAE